MRERLVEDWAREPSWPESLAFQTEDTTTQQGGFNHVSLASVSCLTGNSFGFMVSFGVLRSVRSGIGTRTASHAGSHASYRDGRAKHAGCDISSFGGGVGT